MVAGVVGPLHSSREMAGRGAAFADYAERADVFAHGGNCSRADNFAARTAGRRAELGLPFLLGAGCDADVASSAACRVSGRSASVAGVAFTGGGGQPRGTQYCLWPARRAQAHGAGAAMVAGI